MDDIELPAASNKSPFRAMERAVGVPPRLDHAIMLIAAGGTQKAAAAAAGVSTSRLCVFLRSERGQSRRTFWVGQELRALAPKAVRTLERNLGSKNGMASNRAAEAILDRSGLEGGSIRLDGNLTVHFDIAPKREKVIDHDDDDDDVSNDFPEVIDHE